MKIYMVALRSTLTNEVEHTATSDAPIPDDLVQEVENTIIERYEFESDTFVRARVALDNISLQKAGEDVSVRIADGMENRFRGIVRTR